MLFALGKGKSRTLEFSRTRLERFTAGKKPSEAIPQFCQEEFIGMYIYIYIHILYTPKINMEPENWWFLNVSPFPECKPKFHPNDPKIRKRQILCEQS